MDATATAQGEGDEERRLVARHILQRLGEAGQPPEHEVRRINVGNESYLRVLEHEYFRNQLRIGAAFKLVQGYFGGGKTHFLYCVRELAWRYGFATAVVELSPSECPYDDNFKVYAAVARRISLKPAAPLSTPNFGIGELVRTRVDEQLDAVTASYEAEGRAEPEAAARKEVDRWLKRTVGRAPCESHSFRQAVVELGRAHLAEHDELAAKLEAWLLAEPVPPSELKDAGVYEQLGRANGFTMLRCLTQMTKALGLGGTALLFDEVDRNLSVSAKRSQAIGDNLRQVIDLCGRHQLPSTLFLYAVPPEFLRNVVPDYPALYQRLRSPVALSVRSPQAVLVDLEQLDLQPVELLDRIGRRILEVFEEAREVRVDHTLQQKNARELALASTEAYFEVNHRRLFVKAWVDFLYKQMIDGEQELDGETARKLVLEGYEHVAGTGGGGEEDFADF